MKNYFKLIVLVFLTVVLAAVTVACAEIAEIIDYPVRVMLADSENLTVTGDRVITVSAGQTAEFDVTVPEGMKVAELSGGAYYEDGKIKIDNVFFPVTIKTTVREYYDCTYSTVATNGGKVSEAKNVTVREDDEVTVTAEAKTRYKFVGWSDGRSIEKGGVIISTDSVYTFNITSDMTLYANFADEDARIVIYNANGGIVTETGGDVRVDIAEDDYHFYVNSLPDIGYFERDGYVLYGYNTAADGSGEYFGLGWNIVSDETVMELYCVWAKESDPADFEYRIDGREVTIIGYNGNDEVIVVPKEIKNRSVVSIEKRAFRASTAHTVILPSTIEYIAEEAFASCEFSTLYLPDSVTGISDASFRKCENFSTLYVNAASVPKYQTYDHGTYSIKYERMMYASRHGLPKLVFTSGSNGTYGVYSEQLEKGLNGEYYVIDYSLHYQTCGMFFVDLISTFLTEDDIFLFLPEPNEFQLGTNRWNAIMWQFFEAAYGCITNVDIRDYDGVFDTFYEFNASRQWMNNTKYTDYWSGINRYGDNDWYRNGEYDGFVGSQGTYQLETDHVNVDNINISLDKVLATGAKSYFSFPSLNKHALAGAAKKENRRTAYENYIRDNLHITVISTIEDYIFNGRYMSGTNYHLSSEGTKIRTDRLIDDIRAQLAKDDPGKWGK